MAEKSCREETSTRRQSFRRSLSEAGLPRDDLERLEAKRKQLDDSIHKYVAAKEREYKSFEKDLIHRHKLGQDKEGARTRRASSESNHEPHDSPRLRSEQQQGAVDALLSAGVRREHIGQPIPVSVVDDDAPVTTKAGLAGLRDRRASLERDKEFVGVFTPAYLPALESRSLSPSERERADSAPPTTIPSSHSQPEPDGVERSHSDPAVLAKGKRPAHLQLSQRTSSSGSSADGKLTSVLKSPTHSSSRGKRKRVSLAVGDTIVAPSDSVPATLNHNSTPSHSRAKTPGLERDKSKAVHPTSNPRQDMVTAPFSPLAQTAMTHESNRAEGESRAQSAATGGAGTSSVALEPAMNAAPRSDVDGDMDFGLGEGDQIFDGDASVESPLDSDDDEVTSQGNLNAALSQNGDVSLIYEESEGIIPEADESDDHAEHLEFRPSSIQQPTSPGFRRPSATIDPIYMGADYERAEHNAVTNEVYGSSYNRPGSFTVGSLGESFMAQHAERRMRERNETQVRQ